MTPLKVNPFESPKIDTGQVPNETGEATLRVTRPWELQGCARAYQIFVDGIRCDSVRINQTITIPVHSGELVVVAKVDGWKSEPIELNVQPGALIDLEVSGTFKRWRVCLIVLYALFAPSHKWLCLKRT
ncbi:hypothetical protein C5Y96_04655 [Blastopirellula marina]|uniref:PEGA domain-containing protein n=1 Tax=Blastopirellula marina TaxID=124 RepID=A0A2S8G3Z2_9BACT|nr:MULTISPECIES: hypothetical protein [Pirellulaceae]PQO39157.1 hypothetical protein C5Y96_04655 [Blastopirellula marina]RCS55465.1 hypothetical protein DTL36_04665 [Bremerella cremea]